MYTRPITDTRRSILSAKQFFDISLAVNLLTDASKRSFLNGRIEEDQRKKEKTAGMEKKRRTMVEVRRRLRRFSPGHHTDQNLGMRRRHYKLVKRKPNEPSWTWLEPTLTLLPKHQSRRSAGR